MIYIVREECIGCDAKGVFEDCPTDKAIEKAINEYYETIKNGYGVAVFLKEEEE